MKRNAIEQMTDALRTLFGNLEGYSSYQSVDFVSERQQVFSQIAAVLSGDPGDEGFFTHSRILETRDIPEESLIKSRNGL